MIYIYMVKICSIYELCIGSIYVAYMRDHIYYIYVFYIYVPHDWDFAEVSF